MTAAQFGIYAGSGIAALTLAKLGYEIVLRPAWAATVGVTRFVRRAVELAPTLSSADKTLADILASQKESHAKQEEANVRLVALDARVSKIEREVTPNGGGSMKDALKRIEGEFRTDDGGTLRDKIDALEVESRRKKEQLDQQDRVQEYIVKAVDELTGAATRR